VSKRGKRPHDDRRLVYIQGSSKEESTMILLIQLNQLWQNVVNRRNKVFKLTVMMLVRIIQ
jgi:hypothetical protein